MAADQAPTPVDGIALLCPSCARSKACWLGLRGERLIEEGRSAYDVECGPHFEGGSGVAHGGWVSGVLDEVGGHLPYLHGVRSVTGSLSVRFARPVPVGVPLRAEARLDRRDGRRWFIEATLHLASSGAELARAEVIMFERKPDHFDANQRWLEEQAAAGGTTD